MGYGKPAFLLEYDIPFIKIPSAMNQDEELLKEACESGKPVIISTGMSELDEMDRTVELLEKYSKGDYILLHTNSTYPSHVEEINVRLIETMRERYDCLVGYSGHEEDLAPTVSAAVLGACVIERHITLSHAMWGSDQKASLEIQAMAMLRHRVDRSIASLGDGRKVLFESERKKRESLRGN